MAIKIIVCIIIGYLCGNLSSAWVVGKINNVDLRKVGSGNLGTTNVMRTLGKKWGIITYIGDFVKVALPVVLIQYVIYGDMEYGRLLGLIVGFAAVMGHCYPFWLHFKGGKGIATMSAVMAVYDPIIILIGVPMFFAVVFITKYVSVGSLVVSVLFPIWVFLYSYILHPNDYIVAMLCVTLLYTISAFYMHRANIKRLLNGTENKIGQKKKEA